MLDWFLLSITATVFFGIQSFLFKVSVKKRYNESRLILYFTFVSGILSFIPLILAGIEESTLILMSVLAFIVGLFYFIKSKLQLKALHHIPTNIVFTISSSKTMLVVLFGILFFGETLTILQLFLIGLILIILISYHSDKTEKKKKPDYKKGVLTAIIAMIFSALVVMTDKTAALNNGKELYVMSSYFFTVLFAIISLKFQEKKPLFKKKELKLGIIMGIISIVAFYLYFFALTTGPVAIISPIISLYVLLTALLGYVIYKEELTKKRILLMITSLVAVVLLKLN